RRPDRDPGRRLSRRRLGRLAGPLEGEGERLVRDGLERPRRRVGAHRPEVRGTPVSPPPAVRRREGRVRRDRVRGDQQGPDRRRPGEADRGRRRRGAGGPARGRAAGPRGPRDELLLRARSAPLARRRALAGGPHCEGPRRPRGPRRPGHPPPRRAPHARIPGRAAGQRLVDKPRSRPRALLASVELAMLSEDPRRTSPDIFLKLIEKSRRGKLKIYIGHAAGVGKSYQMLEDAHLLKKQGVDVVAGFVETHGRADTAERVGDLEVIPRRRVSYKGKALEEMDLPAILARKPEVVIVDELAHTN